MRRRRILQFVAMFLMTVVLAGVVAPLQVEAAKKGNTWVRVAGKGYLLKGRNGIRSGDYYTSVKVNGIDYIMDSGGWMVRGWYTHKSGNTVKKYYLHKSGKYVGLAVVGWKKIKGKTYYFDHLLKNRGVMVTGWRTISGNYYYFNKKGVMQTGWIKTNGAWRYCKKNGTMAFNETLTIKGKKYSFGPDGKLKK